MTLTLVPGASLHPEPWRNGLGTSRTIATRQGEHGLLWMVGIADLERDADFSHYPGIDRVFTPIEGGAPELSFHSGPFEPCPLLIPKPFPGDIPTTSRIPSPGRAFNALADRNRFMIDVRVLHPGEAIALESGNVTVLHCLEGSATVAGFRLGPNDSLHGSEAATAAAEPGALLLVATFKPHSRP